MGWGEEVFKVCGDQVIPFHMTGNARYLSIRDVSKNNQGDELQNLGVDPERTQFLSRVAKLLNDEREGKGILDEEDCKHDDEPGPLPCPGVVESEIFIFRIVSELTPESFPNWSTICPA